MNLEKSYLTIDGLIREGKHAEARQGFKAASKQRLPRRWGARFASLGRRLREPQDALRVLHRWVRPANQLKASGTEEERLEYSASLIRLGAVEEATALLKDIDGAHSPKAWLFLGFGSMHRWDYENAVEFLERFLKVTAVASYDYQVAQVNLAAALICTGEGKKARALLDGLLDRVSEPSLLRGNILELSAQNEIEAGRREKALGYLDEAWKLLSSSKNLESFFIQKWRSIARLDSKSRRKDSEYLALRNKAIRIKHWESVRDLDFHWARSTNNQELLTHVWFGSPYPSFRKDIERSLKLLPESYSRELGNGVGTHTIEAITGETNGKSDLKPEQVPHRLLKILNGDFYRPRRIWELHEALYPLTFFSPLSSRNRVHQAINRLKSFFKEAAIPLQISESAGFFALKAAARSDVKIICSRFDRGASLATQIRTRLSDFETSWKNHSGRFSAQEFARRTGTPQRTAVRYLSQASKAGVLSKHAKGSRTQYELK